MKVAVCKNNIEHTQFRAQATVREEKIHRVVATMPDDESLKGIPRRPHNSKKEKP
jgi:hypothetical protein